MDVVILVCLILNFCLLLFLLISFQNNKKDSTDMTERIGRFEVHITKSMNDDFANLKEKIEQKLNQIDYKVNERLNENFEKTNKTFSNVLERLSRIDEAQKKIEGLSTDIVSLQQIKRVVAFLEKLI